MVIRLDKLVTAFLVPFWIGSGNFLYPFAIGLIIALSKPWLKENVALFNFSKQSLIFLGCCIVFYFDMIYRTPLLLQKQ